jgi:hypothetical protein
LPEIVETVAIVSVPPERLKVVPLATVKLWTESDALDECVTVIAPVLI